jgi:predicted flap endonuclease-1-like 5' DNA nuclease
MNFWTGLILGIIIGWLVEWIIDWLFWRRDAEEAREADMLVDAKMAKAVDLDADWEGRLANAEQEYQERLRAVEEEWQDRLNLNEQQWQSQFTAIEEENSDLRSRLSGAALGAAGAALILDPDAGSENEASYVSPEDSILADEMVIAELSEEDVAFADSPDPDDWTAGPLALDAATGDLSQLGEIDSDLAERFHLAGIDSAEALAAADPTALAVAMGVERAETESWIERAAATQTGIAADVAAPAAHRDDLTRVHGIGPRYAAVLADAGIVSFEDLAAASPDQLRDIIKPSPMQQINFNSWANQAVALAGTRSVQSGDDLTELEGIGPVYAAKLRERGILTFADLAAADEATLNEIIAAPAWRRINYGEWIAQAKLATAGDRIALHELQTRLFRRGGDNLNLIQGMGERSATALQAAGITSFAALAGSSPQQLDEIIRGAGVRGGYDYEAWINEARLRAAGKRLPVTRGPVVQIVSCPQDLSAVTGIGRVFEERLYAAGIGSYWALAELPVDRLTTILDAQAFQNVDLNAIKASAMHLAAETNTLGRAWDGTPPDDFDGLPGIGEVYERRLYEAGICTYEAMASATPERLADICKAPAMRAPDYAAWIATAADLSAAKRSG